MDAFAEELRAKGLRSTAQRRAVLTALEGAPHSTAPGLESALGVGRPGAAPERTGDGSGRTGDAPAFSRQGLYNVLDDLTRAGLVRRIEPAGSAARYELRVGDNHHHVVCRSCGDVEDVDCVIGAAPCLEPLEDRGFVIEEAEVTWWGVCGPCRAAEPARGG
ncbi:Fur family transcriptional regulator [Streptomyces tsukubensis]|uniref:Transcriptional repressor n=1 Tax=Streptomyces tsukubensis TaxID=83656 RepID=A0A1V4A4K2_9ACTN|nr:Fur family transcriptional regulator [Streptomyces tsukubensis]OON75380.1 transcriptional repressor [Streptomyces tsukubensis]QFR94990.1 transcriptional repressor [Streptomyces tsukubensis]